MWSSTRRWMCRDGGDGGGGDGGGGGRHVVGHVEMVVMEVVVDMSLDVSTWWCVWRWWSSTRRWTCRHGGIGGGGCRHVVGRVEMVVPGGSGDGGWCVPVNVSSSSRRVVGHVEMMVMDGGVYLDVSLDTSR